MIVYLDTSILLSKLFKESPPLEIWGKWEVAYTSSLTRVEGLRTIDRLRLQGKLTDRQVAEAIQTFEQMLRTVGEIPVSSSVLKRASLPFPTVVRTLDAIHLASALLWEAFEGKGLTFLTYDAQLGTAAQASGLLTSP